MTMMEESGSALGAEVTREATGRQWFGALDLTRLLGAVVFGLLALYPFLAGDVTLSRFTQILLFGLVAIGMNFTMGVAGEFAIGQMGLFAAGAYTAGILTTKAAWDFWPAVAVSCLVATVVGVVVAAPGLRVGGWSFAMASLLVAVVVPDVIRQARALTGGDQGLGGLPLPSVGARDLTAAETYLLVLGSTLLVLFILWRIESSIWGLAFASMRNSQLGAQANGISIRRLKLGAYLVSSLVAGYAGAIFAAVIGFLTPDTFSMSLSILAVAAVVAGGTGTLTGPLVGMAILLYIPDLTASFDRYSLLVYGVVLIGVMLLVPGGIVPTLGGMTRRLVEKVGLTHRLPSAAAAVSEQETSEVDQGRALSRLPACVRPNGLEIDALSKSFGGTVVLDGITFTAAPGEITSVIGPNGSGKTTLLNLVSGYLVADAGTVKVGARAMGRGAPHTRVRQGISRTFQTPILIPSRTALTNVVCAAFRQRKATLFQSLLHTPASRRDLRTLTAHAHALLTAVGMDGVADVRADALTPGQQRLVEVACAIAREPSIVLLDEPAAGLIGDEAEALSHVLLALKQCGYTVVLVEHNVNMVVRISDRIIVLNQGHVIADADPATVMADPTVIDSYLGRSTHAARG